MKTLKFANGDEMPILGLGTFKSEPGKVGEIVYKAIRAGYRHFDCAAFYGNENEIGAAIQRAIAEGLVTREQLWITSKLWNDNHLKEDVKPALKKTLEDLQLDYLDLYLMHWPVAHKKGVAIPSGSEDFYTWDEAPLELTWEGMEDCVDEKLVSHIGVCNCNIKVLREIIACAWIPPEMNQVEMHPYLPQMSLVDFCKENDIHMTAYGPLGSPYRSADSSAPTLLEEPLVKEIAEAHQCSPAQVLIAWGLSRKIAIIPKTVSENRLLENFESTNIQLDRDEIRQLGLLPKVRYVMGDFFTIEGSPYKLTDLWEY